MSFDNSIFSIAEAEVHIGGLLEAGHCGGCSGCSGCSHVAN
jgi:hypothetical protein